MGPSVSSYDTVVSLIHAGMNVARLNFSHGTHEEHARTIAILKKARKETKKPLAVMLDMQGPKVRVEQLKGGSLSLSSGQAIHLVPGGNGTPEEIPFHPAEIIKALKPGMKVLFDDGYITSKVVQVFPNRVELEVLNSGILKNGKGINIPGVSLPLPALTEEDKKDLHFGCSQDVDFVAASFIRSAHHVRQIKEALIQEGFPEMPVFAKIESLEGVENFDSIVKEADGILIARGDLGVEVDLATVPRLQKMMIRKCYAASKPVITATHMMESMIVYPRPTRAEVSDVANAVYDYTSMIMLSAETAVGKYPIETVSLMQRIAQETESDIDYSQLFNSCAQHLDQDLTSSLSLTAVKMAYEVGARAIFSMTISVITECLVSKWRPGVPVIALADSEKEYHRLGAYWGVIPVFCPKNKNREEVFALLKECAQTHDLIALGDAVIVITENLSGKTGSANPMVMEYRVI